MRSIFSNTYEIQGKMLWRGEKKSKLFKFPIRIGWGRLKISPSLNQFSSLCTKKGQHQKLRPGQATRVGCISKNSQANAFHFIVNLFFDTAQQSRDSDVTLPWHKLLLIPKNIQRLKGATCCTVLFGVSWYLFPGESITHDFRFHFFI